MVSISGDLLKQFTDLIPNIPSIDSLITPVSSCTPDIAGLLNSGSAFANPLSSALGDCQLEIGNLIGSLGGLGGLTSPQQISVDSAITALTGANSGLTDFSGHTNGLITGLPQNMGSILGCMRSRATLGSSLPVNPCKLLDDIMGSVLGVGGQLLNSLVDAIAPIAAAILVGPAAIVAAIAGALAPLANAVAGIADQIAKELKMLTDVFSEVENFSFANAIANQANDPCLQSIFNAVGTPDLIGCLASNLPDFNIF